MLLSALNYAGYTLLYLMISVLANTIDTAQIYTKSRFDDDKQDLGRTVAVGAAEIPLNSIGSASGSSSGSSLDPIVKIKCLSGYMLIVIDNAPKNHESGRFSGMIYPKGLSKNSTCLTEYRNQEGTLRYMLPLRSCNTMPQETEDGGIEFFNTIVIQPHLKLITDAGRSYHIRCSYKSRDAAFVAKKLHHKLNMMKEKRKYVQKPQAFRSSSNYETEDNKSQLTTTADRHSHARSIQKYSENETFDNNNNNHNNNIDFEEEEDKFSFQRKFKEENVDGGRDGGGGAGEELLDTDYYMEDGDLDTDLPMPGCHMKIYNADNKIANDVQIGDPLTIVINVDKQDVYGLHITNCIVRDGLGWGEQLLVGDDGCPMDNEIMGQFKYSSDNLAANVTFPAHKFPYTTSVYYQCNVQLCSLKDPDCQMSPLCSGKRPKRQTINDSKDEEGLPATIEVFSGLYVNENVDVVDGDDDDDNSVLKQKTLEDAICVSQRTFAIAIAVAGLILMLAVVAAVLCIMAKRSGKTLSHSGSSIYSGPYTNTAFSHSS